jgi:hypothetical protein
LRDYLEGRSSAIARKDYRKLIEELSRTPDVDASKEYWLQMKVEKLMGDWYEADPDAALQWALGQKDPARTASLLSSIIGRLAEKDLEAALALAKRHGADDGRHLDMPEQIKAGLSKTNAEELLRIMGLFTRVRGQSGGPVQFADGFDFQRVLEGVAEMDARLKPQDANVAFMPSNLLSEWAKRDWDAAWKWALADKDRDLSELAKSVAGTTSTEEYASLAAFTAAVPDRDPRVNDRQVWDILAERPSPELIAGFLAQAPGERQETLSRILVASSEYSGGHYDAAQEVFLSQMTPAERLAAFQSEAFVAFLNEPRERVPQIYKETREKYTSLLRRLGHSEAEFEQMFPTRSEPDGGSRNQATESQSIISPSSD